MFPFGFNLHVYINLYPADMEVEVIEEIYSFHFR